MYVPLRKVFKELGVESAKHANLAFNRGKITVEKFVQAVKKVQQQAKAAK